MTTRTINIALVEQVPQVRKLYFTPVLASIDEDLLIEEQYNVETDDTGVGTIDLPVRDSGNIRYNYEVPSSDGGTTTGFFLLEAGDPIDISELLNSGGVATDSVKQYIDQQIAAAIAGLMTSGDVDAAIATALEGFTADGVEVIEIVCGDRLTPLVVASNIGSRRMPFPFTLSGIRASLDVAQASGSVFTINVKENGTTVLSTLITIDNGELTSVTAVTPAVISDPDLADDALVSVDVTQVGSGEAAGLVVQLIGTKANA